MAAAGLAGAAAQSCTYPTAAVLSGFEGTFAGTLSATNNRAGFNIACSGTQSGTLPVNSYAALVRIDLPATGSPVVIDTCGSVVDTMISVGNGCPDTTSFGYACRGFNDDATSNFCTVGASRVTVNATSSSLYVMVTTFGNEFGAYTVNYRYLAPSQSPTASQTPSSSQTGSASFTPGLPPSFSGTPSQRPPPPSQTPSISVTSTVTPSNSPTQSLLPACLTQFGFIFNGTFRGTSGSTGYMNMAFGSPAAFGVETCGSTGVLTNQWSHHRLAIDLGANTPLGFDLTLETCTAVGFTSIDTRMFAGVGCPSSWLAFGCSAANDNTVGCGNGLQSRVVIPATQRFVYVVMQGSGSTNSGPYNLTWRYALVSGLMRSGGVRVSPARILRSRWNARALSHSFSAVLAPFRLACAADAVQHGHALQHGLAHAVGHQHTGSWLQPLQHGGVHAPVDALDDGDAV